MRSQDRALHYSASRGKMEDIIIGLIMNHRVRNTVHDANEIIFGIQHTQHN